jgi:hypothetical protein
MDELGADGGDGVGQLSWVQRKLRRATRVHDCTASAGGRVRGRHSGLQGSGRGGERDGLRG